MSESAPSIPHNMSLSEIKSEGEKDEVIQEIKKALKTHNWENPVINTYAKFKSEICESDGVILKENKIVLRPFREKL